MDLLRALSIVVVVLWHWTFSITHRRFDGTLTMPNPIGDLPGLFVATWLLQVMPLFFAVGGFANHAAFTAHRRRGLGDAAFVRSRVIRLVRPSAIFLAAWALIEGVRVVSGSTAAPVWTWGRVLFVPLWFVVMYGCVCALAPLMVRLFDRFGVRSVMALGVVVVALDALHRSGLRGVTLPLALLTFLTCHQLGMMWRACTGDRARERRLASVCGALGLAGLVVIPMVLPVSSSLVAIRGEGRSNMAPPSVMVVCGAMFQLAVALAVAPAARRWLSKARVWKATIIVNAMSMTVLVWHMTAYLFAHVLFETLGGKTGSEATMSWWLTRPLWIALPFVFLVPIVAVFRRFEK